MRPADTGAVTPPSSAEEPAVESPVAAPGPAPAASSTTTAISTAAADTAETAAAPGEPAAAPTLDIFGGKVSLSLCFSLCYDAGKVPLDDDDDDVINLPD